MKKEDKLIQVLAAKTSKFFKELLKFQENYKKTGQFYLDDSEFFGKDDPLQQSNNTKTVQPQEKITTSAEESKLPRKEKTIIITQIKKSKTGMPKKPPTAYLTFFTENRQEYAKAHQELTPNQVAQMLGKQWREMNQKSKDVYQKKYELENKRYIEELLDYEQKNGIIRKKKIQRSHSHQKKVIEDIDESELLKNQIQEIQKKLALKNQEAQVEESDDIILAPGNTYE